MNKIKKEISDKLRIFRTLAIILIFLGTLLVIYMINVEDEPGALPLFLIITGTVWFIVNRNQIKKYSGRK